MRIILYKKNNLVNSTGGVEKVMCNMANFFASQGKEVFFITRDEKEGKPFFFLDNKIEFMRVKIDFSYFRRGLGKFLDYLKLIDFFPYFNRESFIAQKNAEIIEKINPDVIVVAGLPDLVDLVYEQNYKCPIILMFHSLPSVYFKVEKRVLKNYNSAVTFLYSY